MANSLTNSGHSVEDEIGRERSGKAGTKHESILFGHETVLAMWRQVNGVNEAGLASLGFRRIAGSDLIYRHSGLSSDFSDEHPTGLDAPLDFEAEESDQQWVLRQWDER